jgi:hypothetical protein
MNERSELERVLNQGQQQAEAVAQATVERVRKGLGFLARH